MNLRQALTSLPFYFLEDLIQELLGKISVTNRSAQVRVLAETLERRETLRALWERLDPDEKAAVQMALYNGGKLDLARYEAMYGELPVKPFSGIFGHRRKPQYLKLFFLASWELPDEMLLALVEWVEPPLEFQPFTLPGLPALVRVDKSDIEVMVVETEQAAWHDLAAVLRQVRDGHIKVSESTFLPSTSVLKPLQKELVLLDYYEVAEARAADTIRPCGLVISLQGGGLAKPEGATLRLTEAGEEWLQKPSAEGLRQTFQNWIKSIQLDELRRLGGLRGLQTGGAVFTRPEQRRRAILGALNRFKPGEWVPVEEFFKTIKLQGHNFVVEPGGRVSIQVAGFGLLDAASEYTRWQAVNGQYILVVLMEYLASFGVIDLGCVDPKKSGYPLGSLETYVVRPLSRYDGLKFIRLTPLGAYLLGKTHEYTQSTTIEPQPLLEYGENLHLLLRRAQALNPNDRLLMERFSVRLGENLYRLDPQRTLLSFEEGLKLDDALSFLERKTLCEPPEAVRSFFERLRKRSMLLTRKAEAVLFQVKDVELMKSLLADEVLGDLCVLAEDHQLVVQTKHEEAFRRRLHELEAGVKS